MTCCLVIYPVNLKTINIKDKERDRDTYMINTIDYLLTWPINSICTWSPVLISGAKVTTMRSAPSPVA